MGLEPLDKQVVDGGKVVVAFVLQRLKEERQWAGEQNSTGPGTNVVVVIHRYLNTPLQAFST